MTASVDITSALELLEKLAPELAAYEASAPAGAFASRDDDVALERALRAGLARLRVSVTRETFIYLQWRAEHAAERRAGGAR